MSDEKLYCSSDCSADVYRDDKGLIHNVSDDSLHTCPYESKEQEERNRKPSEWDCMLNWAVRRWNAEVKNRPLVNVHRRTLDDTWRQVIRYAGGDPDKLVGPSHDALIANQRDEYGPYGDK